MVKRIFGVIFLLLGAVFALAFIGQIPDYVSLLADLIGVVIGKKDAYQVGYIIGQTLFFIVLFIVTLLLFKYGWRWVRKRPVNE